MSFSGTRRLMAGLALTLCLAMAGCGGSSGSSAGSATAATPPAPPPTSPPASPPASPTDDSHTGACALLTAEEVSQVVGAPVKPGRPFGSVVGAGGFQQTCEWLGLKPPLTQEAKVTVFTDPAAYAAAATTKQRDLPGLGDKAFVGEAASVVVARGQRVLLAQWFEYTRSNEQDVPKSEALARAALAKLP